MIKFDRRWTILNSMRESKLSEEKEKYIKSKIKNYLCQEERFLKWKEHFKNLLRIPSDITDKLIQEIIHDQLDFQLGQFTEEELDTVLKKNQKQKNCKT